MDTNDDSPIAQHAPHQEEEEEEEAVFIRGVNTDDDSKTRNMRDIAPFLNGEEEATLLVKIEGDALQTRHAQHRPRPRFDESPAL